MTIKIKFFIRSLDEFRTFFREYSTRFAILLHNGHSKFTINFSLCSTMFFLHLSTFLMKITIFYMTSSWNLQFFSKYIFMNINIFTSTNREKSQLFKVTYSQNSLALEVSFDESHDCLLKWLAEFAVYSRIFWRNSSSFSRRTSKWFFFSC